jgi:hypothetical protein
VLYTRDPVAEDIHINDTDCSFFFPESLREYFWHLPPLPDRSLHAVVLFVRTVLAGAVAQEQRERSDQANAGGEIDVAILDRSGAHFA